MPLLNPDGSPAPITPTSNPNPIPTGQTESSPTPPPLTDPQKIQKVHDLLQRDNTPTPINHDKYADDLLSQIDSQVEGIKHIPEDGLRSLGQGMWEHLPQELKVIGAQMRARLGRNPKEQKQAFESMFGAENVKDGPGGSLLFRPNKDENFRKMDDKVYGPIADFVIFNALNAIPLAANVGTQTMTTGEGGPVGLALSGAAGGAAEGLTRQGMISALNKVSAQPQTGSGIEDVAKSTAVNAVASPIIGGTLLGARNLIGKVGSAISKEFPLATEAIERTAGAATTKLASIRNAFNQFLDVVYPHASSLDEPEVFAGGLKNVFDKAEDRLGGMVGQIKGEVTSMANQQGKKVSMDNTLKSLKDTLTDYGYGFPRGKADNTEIGLIDADKLNLVKPDVQGALDKLANHYNKLVGQAGAEGGTLPEEMFSDIEKLGKLSKFDKKTPTTTGADEAARLYEKVWKGSVSDRNAFINQMYAPNGSKIPGVTSDNWINEFQRFHDQIGAVRDMKGILRDEGSRETFLNAILGGNKAEKANFLEATKNVLGNDSPEWNGLQGQMVNYLIKKFSPNGYVQAGSLLKYINNVDNEAVVSRLFDKKDLTVFQKMLLEGAKAEGQSSLTDIQKSAVREGVKMLMKHSVEPVQAVHNIMSGLGSSKTKVNYLLDEGFQDMIDSAEGPALKAKIIEARRLMESLTSNMKVADIPTTLQNGVRTTVKRYVPTASASAATAARNIELEKRGMAADANEARIQQNAQQQTSPQMGTPTINPNVVEQLAKIGGYRNQPGAHPVIVSGAPGARVNIPLPSR